MSTQHVALVNLVAMGKVSRLPAHQSEVTWLHQIEVEWLDVQKMKVGWIDCTKVNEYIGIH